MQTPVSVFLLALALVVAAPAALAAETAPCVQAKDDPAGDTTVPAGIPGFDSKPADLLGVELAWLDEGARLSVSLNGDPRVSGAGPMTYSYWVGFEDGGNSANGNTAAWTFQGSTTYDEIRTMYWDGPQSYPVVWNGTTFSFVVPWDSFKEQYGKAWPLDFGTPRASSSGPSGAGLNNPGQDSVQYASDLVPLGPCPTPEAGATAPTGPAGGPAGGTEGEDAVAAGLAPAKASPLPALWAAALTLLVVAGLRRR